MKLICLMNYYWLQDRWESFNNNMSTDIKVSKAQTSKIIQSRGFLESLLSRLLGPIMKVAVPLAKKSFSSISNYSGYFSNWCRNLKENTWFRDNNFNNFKWGNEWQNEIVQALEDSNILLKGIAEKIKNETKEQKRRFLSMLLSTLGASLLGNLLSGKGIVRAGYGNKKGKGIVRAGYGSEMDF